MNFVIDNWMLIAIAAASAAMLLLPLIKGAQGNALSPAQAVQLINRSKAVVVDVCEADEYAGGHLRGSKNLPLGQLEEKLTAAVKNKTLPLILVCQSGKRATRALGIAQKLGYEQAQVLHGGMKAWKEANLPVEAG